MIEFKTSRKNDHFLNLKDAFYVLKSAKDTG